MLHNLQNNIYKLINQNIYSLLVFFGNIWNNLLAAVSAKDR